MACCRHLDDRPDAPEPAVFGSAGERKAEKVVGPVPKGHGLRRLQRGLPDQRQDGAGDDVPFRVQMDRDHRLDVEDVLRALVRAVAEIRVVLERDAARSPIGFCSFLARSVAL